MQLLLQNSVMKLSIIIAAYNVESFIEKCIRSCYDKNLKNNYEIIVVNDGSTDKTSDIVTGLLSRIPNLKLINKKNTGLGAARNTGIQEAKGDYLWMIDGDDFIETGQLENILAELGATALDIYCMNYNITDAAGAVTNIAYPLERLQEEFEATAYYEKYKMNSYTWQYIFKRALFNDHNLLFKPSINMQDSEIMPKIIFYAHSVIYLPVVAYNYVQHDFSFTNTINPQKRLRYFESIVEVNKSLEDFKIKIQQRNGSLAEAINDKQNTLHKVVFNHLVFFKYDRKWLLKIVKLLEINSLYPLQYKAVGKMKVVKVGLNNYPLVSKWIIDKIRKNNK